MRSDTQCPGCGARNAPEARVCEWCGRAFLLRDQPRRGRWLWSLAATLCALAAALVAGLALLNGSGILPSTSGSLPGPTVPAPATPEPPAAPSTAGDEPTESAPEPVEYVRVTNTGSQGIILRSEPNTSAARVAARAENAVLQIVGPDEAANGRVWRHVQDAQGNRGWVPAEFLAPAPPPGS